MKNIMNFFRFKKTSLKSTTNPKKTSDTEFKYHFFRQNWIVFKLLVRLFFNDWIAIFITIILPFCISISYLILYKTKIVPENLFGYKSIAGVNNIKIWYEFSIYSIGFIAFIYLAVSIADIKHTILFKKIISGFTTKGILLMLFFIFYFLLAIFTIGTKFAIFSFYPSFKNNIMKITKWKYMIFALILFVLTNLSLGLLFSSFKITAKSVFPITLVACFGMLFFAGLWIGPTDIENLFFTDSRSAALNYSKISSSAQVWRYLTFLSPFQPSMQTMIASSSINEFENIMTTEQPNEFYSSNFEYFGSSIIKNQFSSKSTFSSLEEFKKAIITPEGLEKWIDAIKIQVPDAKSAKIILTIEQNAKNFADALKNKKVFMNLEPGSFYYNFKIVRSGVYSNYLTPFLVNIGWILAINSFTLFLWKKTSQY